MKKLVNGVQIGLNVDFWLDYLYGKALNKITISNIHTDLSDLNANSVKIIKKYEKIYDNCDQVFKDLENDLKYGVLGELMGIEYTIYNQTLYVKDNKNYISFKGEHWAIPEKGPKSNVKLATLANEPLYDIFYNILKRKGKYVIQDNFPDLWNAVDQSEEKLERELNSILTYVTTEPIKILPNTIVDYDNKIKYTIFKESVIDKSATTMNIDLNAESVSNTAQHKVDKISIFKQDFLSFSRQCNDFGVESKVNVPSFMFIENELKKHIQTDVKGVILNNILYFELENNVYKVANNRCSLLVKNGSIYGYIMKDLLISNVKKVSDVLEKQVIFLLKNNTIDPVKYEFRKIGEGNE